ARAGGAGSRAAAPAAGAGPAARRLCRTRGCAGCHAIRGTGARGTAGPGLTHVGGRLALGAGGLPNEPQAMARWIRDTAHVKPENLMPPFAIFTDAELRDLATYLEGLE